MALVDPPSGASEDLPKEVVVGFWTLVLLVKVAVIAVGAGLVILTFTDVTWIGLGLLLLGGIVVVRWIVTYRRLRANHDVR